MTGISARDQHQLELIRARLVGWRSGELALGRLIADLDALWVELGGLSEGWRSAFRIQWGTLEQVYAAALDRESVDALPADLEVLVEEAVDQLGFLVDEAAAG